MPNFYSGFTQGFNRGSQRGIQQMRVNEEQEMKEEQFNERMQLQRRAQAIRRKQAEAEIERLNQEIDQADTLFPYQKQQAQAGARRSQAQADTAETKAEKLPEQIEGEMALTAAQTMGRQVRTDMMRTRQQKLQQQLETMRQQQQQRRQAANARQDQMNTVADQPPMDVPEAKGDTSFDFRDVGQAAYNTQMYAASTINSLFGGDGEEMYQEGRLSDEDVGQGPTQQKQQQGRQAIKGEMDRIQQMTNRMNNAPRGGQSPQAAATLFRRTQQLERALDQNNYGYSEEEKQALRARIKAQQTQLSRYAPKTNRAAQGLFRAGSTSMQEGNYGDAVDAFESLMEGMPGGGTGSNASPYGPQQTGMSGQGGG